MRQLLYYFTEVVVFNFTLGIAWLETFSDMKNEETKQFAGKIEQSVRDVLSYT